MARELHDVVAHHVSLIAVQSEAAQVLLPDQPARATEAVAAIGTTAREALTELRRLLGALREEGDGPPSRSPQPGDLAIAALVESVRDAGVPVSLSSPVPFPAGDRPCPSSVTSISSSSGP